MGQILFTEVTLDDLIDRVARESSNRVIKEVRKILTSQPANNKNQISQAVRLTRKETAEYLGVSPPTIDRYTEEGLLKKYGAGKRARYILTEVENAKPLIMESLHKWKLPPARSYRK